MNTLEIAGGKQLVESFLPSRLEIERSKSKISLLLDGCITDALDTNLTDSYTH